MWKYISTAYIITFFLQLYAVSDFKKSSPVIGTETKPLTTALCISCNVFRSQKFPILQIVLFNFPVLKSLTLVKLFSCKSFNPLEPCANIHPHPSSRERLVQPKCNRGSKHDALDEVPSYVLLIHITSLRRLITYWVGSFLYHVAQLRCKNCKIWGLKKRKLTRKSILCDCELIFPVPHLSWMKVLYLSRDATAVMRPRSHRHCLHQPKTSFLSTSRFSRP